MIDEEAAAVEAYAALDRPDSDEEMYEPSIAAEDEEGPEGDLESEVTDPVPPSAGGSAVPAEPSERRMRWRTFRFSRGAMIALVGRARKVPTGTEARRRKSPQRDCVVQIDYMFLGRKWDELALLTIFVAVDVESGYLFAMQVPRKGMKQGKYALENLGLLLDRLGYDKVILQHDAEHSVAAVASLAASRISTS